LAAISLSVLAALTGCGSTQQRENKPRPPAPINIAVVLGDNKIDASPKKFGAGPVVFQIANEASVSHTLTVDGPQVKQSVGPINPDDTATLKVSLRPGEQTLAVDGAGAVEPAVLAVGPPRPGAENELLQP
jgi:hypothetical protein